MVILELGLRSSPDEVPSFTASTSLSLPEYTYIYYIIMRAKFHAAGGVFESAMIAISQ